MRIVFMGTPEFAVPSLDILVKEGYEVVAVVTQPDKPKGRGNKMSSPPVKEYAVDKGLKVLQPSKIKTLEFVSELSALKPDLLITVAYGKILSKDILDIPKFGCINVHGSLLPKYRGAAPIHWAIINGENVTGITTMFTDVGLDTGDMLLKSGIKITDDMAVGELHDKMSVLGAEVLKETLEKLKNGTIERVPQSESEATYAPILKKEVGQINWTKTADEIHNLVRGTNPWPGAYTLYKGEKMRIWKSEVVDDFSSKHRAGTICEVGRAGVIAAAARGMIIIKEIQFDSGKRMSVEEYTRGHRIDVGEIFG